MPGTRDVASLLIGRWRITSSQISLRVACIWWVDGIEEVLRKREGDDGVEV
jgi:hypothetical protein